MLTSVILHLLSCKQWDRWPLLSPILSALQIFGDLQTLVFLKHLLISQGCVPLFTYIYMDCLDFLNLDLFNVMDFVCIYVYTPHAFLLPVEIRRGPSGPLELELDGFESLFCRCRESYPGPLQKQQLLLTTESFLQPLKMCF